MIGVDTNVLVRMIARDDPVQTPIAEQILDRAGEDGLFVSLVVLAELAWVLRRAYRYQPDAVLTAIEGVLAGREFVIERPELAASALSNARNANCGYADALIEQINVAAGAGMTLTFDDRAKRLPSMSDAAGQA